MDSYAPGSLLAYSAQIPDPRGWHGRGCNSASRFDHSAFACMPTFSGSIQYLRSEL